MKKKTKNKAYVYALNEKKKDRLPDFGFVLYEDPDTGDPEVWAVPLRMPISSPIPQKAIRTLEHIWRLTNDGSGKGLTPEDFSEYRFDADGKLILDGESSREFTDCQLCISAAGEDKGLMFINAPDGFGYHAAEDLDACAHAAVSELLAVGVISKKALRRKGDA